MATRTPQPRPLAQDPWLAAGLGQRLGAQSRAHGLLEPRLGVRGDHNGRLFLFFFLKKEFNCLERPFGVYNFRPPVASCPFVFAEPRIPPSTPQPLSGEARRDLSTRLVWKSVLFSLHRAWLSVPRLRSLLMYWSLP